MKKVNVEQLTGALNKFRMENLEKTFTSTEIYEAFEKLGFNKSIAKLLTRFMNYEKLGTAKLFTFSKDPIHISQIRGIYDDKRKSVRDTKIKHKSELSEEAALNLLSLKGYQIRKCIGFDLERFQKENPVLYKKYLKYEII